MLKDPSSGLPKDTTVNFILIKGSWNSTKGIHLF
jgi:hypothetical protein